MTVALPSEPANYFHLLRRHALDGVRRPLVVFTPKSMLRNRAVVSPLADFTEGRFREVIDDPRYRDADGPAPDVRKLVLCSGKIYWELAAARDKQAVEDTAIVRIEQLYPLPHRRLAEVLERYPNATDVRWVQEEPANQGAWPYFGLELPEKLPERLSAIKRISRRRMAAPAPGSSKILMPLAGRSRVAETGAASPADVVWSWCGLSPCQRLTLEPVPVGHSGLPPVRARVSDS
jgi:multifunctional 2-oxoglutarate metabolism enzyme